MYKDYVGKPLDDEIEHIIDDVVERHHGTVKVFNNKK